jgi:hypothetical protein
MNRGTVRTMAAVIAALLMGLGALGTGAALGFIHPMPPCCGGGGQPDYGVYVNETGLPTGTVWWVNYDGYNLSTNLTHQAGVFVFNGSYTYFTTTFDGYTPSPQSALSIVHGHEVSILIKFTLVNYEITFKESGLPSGTEWGVALSGGAVVESTATDLMIPVANGTYSYKVFPPQDYDLLLLYNATPSSGTGIVVAGAPVTGPTIKFNSLLWAITVAETGLAKGVEFCSYLNNTTVSNFTCSNAPTSIVFTGLFNGTYSYDVLPVAGYTEAQGSGQITVSGANEKVTAKFTS